MRSIALILGAAACPALLPGQRLLMNQVDLSRVTSVSSRARWAASVRDGILQAAAAWPQSHTAKYGLPGWSVPPEGGQWTLWYVCPVHGVSLQFQPPDVHTCPIDGRRWTDKKFDQVIYTRRNSDNAAAARDLGLAWQFTGKAEYARWSARILLAYADVYSSWRIHDTNDRTDAKSGARATAQTLDEAVWLIPIAWAYDLVSNTLTAAERAHIEQDLLRAAVAVVRRNPVSNNWQCWHDGGIGAAGFALGDKGLISEALDGKYGFRELLKQDVFDDGFWNEGAWGYHFYALEPLWQLAEMGARGGYDLFAETPLRKMFEAPLRFALPDWSLPAFNDSGSSSAINPAHEIAWARYGDPLFGSVLGLRTRGREALFWGAEDIPQPSGPPRESALFEASGYAALRAPGSDFTVILKFGPHGGWHGHYDKLNFVSYARGGIMGLDPGTQSYAAPTHDTWDKVTVAHNTIVVDEKTQQETTGSLAAWSRSGPMTAVRAAAGNAYREASLERTMFLAPEYLVDAFEAKSRDGSPHTFDWVYHNPGSVSASLPLDAFAGFGKANGYQYLGRTQAADTPDGWEARFATAPPEGGPYGSTYVNKSGIKAGLFYSPEQAASGRYSGKLVYDFSGLDGSLYAVYTPPNLSGQPMEAPSNVKMMIYGDGSGNNLFVRLVDQSGQTFQKPCGPIGWTGWREIEAPFQNYAAIGHWGGNNDGVLAVPARSVAIEIDKTPAGAEAGAIFADDIYLHYDAAGPVAAVEFENAVRVMRVIMLGETGTKVVTGDGLGPDLRTPVPFVLARRRGTEARFITLFEPIGAEPAVSGFRVLDDGSFEVAGPGFRDTFSLDAAGLSFVRVSGGAEAPRGLKPAPLRRSKRD